MIDTRELKQFVGCNCYFVIYARGSSENLLNVIINVCIYDFLRCLYGEITFHFNY